MTPTKPEFHLQRIYADGTSDPSEIYSIRDLPTDLMASRRGFLGTGLTAASVLAVISGCQNNPDPVPMPKSPINPVITETIQPPVQPAAAPPKVPQVAAGRVATSVNAHSAAITVLAITPDGTQLASADQKGFIKLWAVPGGELRRILSNGGGTVTAMATMPNDKLLISAGQSLDLTLRESRSTPRKPVYGLKRWSLPDGAPADDRRLIENVRSMAVASNTSTLVWTDGVIIHRVTLPNITDDRFVFDGWPLKDERSRLLRESGLSDNEQQKRRSRDSIVQVAITPDGDIVASVESTNNDIGLHNTTQVTSKKAWRSLAGHSMPVRTIVFSPDGTLLASGADDHQIRLWSVPEAELLKTIAGHDKPVSALSITPDSRLLVSGADDNLIKLWSLPDGDLSGSLSGHEKAVSALAVTPDGKILVSGDVTGVIILWDLSTFEKLGYLFDPQASQTDTFVYNVKDDAGRTLTYTLPCGSAVPAGAVCTCNCVPGTSRPVPVQQEVRTKTHCTCNKICTCIPVCQAHRLSHGDSMVRTMAEELMLVMGESEFEYMHWAAHRAESDLKQRVEQTIAAIQQGAQPNPSRWPTVAECSARLNDPDEIVCVMAAQMIDLQRHKAGWSLDAANTQRVAALLDDARRRPWYVRAN